MRGFIATLAAAVSLAWCGAASAEVNGAAIAGYCAPGGAFGEQFGATAVNGRVTSSFRLMNSRNVELTSFPPFTQAEIVTTDDTHRLHSVTGMANFDTDAEAQAAFAAAVSAFNQDQRFVPQPTGGSESAAFFADDPASAGGFKVELALSGSLLMMACVDSALSRSAQTEWTGNFGFGPTLAATPALTQDWDATAFAQQHCTPEGAFGQQFGQRLRGRSTPSLTEFNRVLMSPGAYPPFQHVEAGITPRSRVVQSISARAAFADARTAAAAYNRMLAAYEASGRFAYRSEDQLLAGPAGVVFSTDEDPSVGYSIFVGLDGHELRLVCSDMALFARSFDEAFSR